MAKKSPALPVDALTGTYFAYYFDQREGDRIERKIINVAHNGALVGKLGAKKDRGDVSLDTAANGGRSFGALNIFGEKVSIVDARDFDEIIHSTLHAVPIDGVLALTGKLARTCYSRRWLITTGTAYFERFSIVGDIDLAIVQVEYLSPNDPQITDNVRAHLGLA